ncbi:mucin-6 [Moschus berezovskii]|uniref:mucin-6 n=1 Tax=Moschus berezovskii TaxID=68408 RepID=UPI0024445168|nr:mucin-6 [Moschus berezovskii]
MLGLRLLLLLSCVWALLGAGLEDSSLVPPGLHRAKDIPQTAPDNRGQCSTWGAGHFSTFDGHTYDFSGTCNYVFAAVCKDAPSTFSVQLRRGPGGNISRIIVELGASAVSVQDAVITVKDLGVVSLPHTSNGLQITPFGQSVRLTAKQLEMELVVMWGPGAHLMVLVERKYMGRMCGLCGNFDGEKTNEFLSEDGQLLEPHKYAALQKLDDPNEICAYEAIPSPQLLQAEHAQTCLQLLTLVAPKCTVPQDPFLLSCQVDMAACVQPGRHNCSCATLSEYSRQCSMAGQPVSSWRGPNLCSVGQCPANQVYRECGEACVQTCSNPQHSCSSFCAFGCFCPEGMVLDDISKNHSCVPESQCPCMLSGVVYAPGEVTTAACQTCRCSGGHWECEERPCPRRCALEGGSFVTTFDARPYRFHGTCTYVLVQSPQLPDGGSLMAVFDKSGYSHSETSLVAVIYKSSQDKIVISQDEVVTNNGDTKWLPYKTRNITVFRQTSTHLQMVTTFGLELVIQLWPVFQLYITVGPQFRGQTRGLCGNFNGDTTDDFTTSMGIAEGTASLFVDSWRAGNCPAALERETDPCSMSQLNKVCAETHCAVLVKKGTVFENCHATVDPKPFYKRCMYQACNYEETFLHICAALGDYALACASRGVLLQGWRSSVDNCSIPCTGNQTFSYDSQACDHTCLSLTDREAECHPSTVPVDGCNCPEGTYLNHKTECVRKAQCPCFLDNHGFILADQSTMVNGVVCHCVNGRLSCPARPQMLLATCSAPKTFQSCSQSSEDKFGAACAPTCQMLATGTPCVPTKCEPGCVCAKGLYENASGQCVPPEECPCEFAGVSYPRGAELHTNCKSCTCSNGTWSCQQSSHCPSTCSLYGEGHVVTFDGQRFVFDGNCEYILVTDGCNASDSQPNFKILTENVVCAKSGATCSRAIKILLGGLSIVLADANYTVSGEDPGVHFRVKAGSLYLVLDITIGSAYNLTLTWNKHMTVFIKVARASQDPLCGLCGNYNGNMKDDFQTRSKYLASSELEFVNSWKESPLCGDTTFTLDPCSLNAFRRSWAERKCSIINSQTFAACHGQVYRLPYYEACVQDTCACDTGGDCECLCDAVAAYAKACVDKGVCVDWRSPDFCPVYCDFYNTHTQVGGEFQYTQEANCTWHYQPCLCPAWPQSVPDNIEGCYNCSQDEYFDHDKGTCVPCVPPPTTPAPTTARLCLCLLGPQLGMRCGRQGHLGRAWGKQSDGKGRQASTPGHRALRGLLPSPGARGPSREERAPPQGNHASHGYGQHHADPQHWAWLPNNTHGPHADAKLPGHSHGYGLFIHTGRDSPDHPDTTSDLLGRVTSEHLCCHHPGHVRTGPHGHAKVHSHGPSRDLGHHTAHGALPQHRHAVHSSDHGTHNCSLANPGNVRNCHRAPHNILNTSTDPRNPHQSADTAHGAPTATRGHHRAQHSTHGPATNGLHRPGRGQHQSQHSDFPLHSHPHRATPRPHCPLQHHSFTPCPHHIPDNSSTHSNTLPDRHTPPNPITSKDPSSPCVNISHPLGDDNFSPCHHPDQVPYHYLYHKGNSNTPDRDPHNHTTDTDHHRDHYTQSHATDRDQHTHSHTTVRYHHTQSHTSDNHHKTHYAHSHTTDRDHHNHTTDNHHKNHYSDSHTTDRDHHTHNHTTDTDHHRDHYTQSHATDRDHHTHSHITDNHHKNNYTHSHTIDRDHNTHNNTSDNHHKKHHTHSHTPDRDHNRDHHTHSHITDRDHHTHSHTTDNHHHSHTTDRDHHTHSHTTDNHQTHSHISDNHHNHSHTTDRDHHTHSHISDNHHKNHHTLRHTTDNHYHTHSHTPDRDHHTLSHTTDNHQTHSHTDNHHNHSHNTDRNHHINSHISDNHHKNHYTHSHTTDREHNRDHHNHSHTTDTDHHTHNHTSDNHHKNHHTHITLLTETTATTVISLTTTKPTVTPTITTTVKPLTETTTETTTPTATPLTETTTETTTPSVTPLTETTTPTVTLLTTTTTPTVTPLTETTTTTATPLTETTTPSVTPLTETTTETTTPSVTPLTTTTTPTVTPLTETTTDTTTPTVTPLTTTTTPTVTPLTETTTDTTTPTVTPLTTTTTPTVTPLTETTTDTTTPTVTPLKTTTTPTVTPTTTTTPLTETTTETTTPLVTPLTTTTTPTTTTTTTVTLTITTTTVTPLTTTTTPSVTPLTETTTPTVTLLTTTTTPTVTPLTETTTPSVTPLTETTTTTATPLTETTTETTTPSVTPLTTTTTPTHSNNLRSPDTTLYFSLPPCNHFSTTHCCLPCLYQQRHGDTSAVSTGASFWTTTTHPSPSHPETLPVHVSTPATSSVTSTSPHIITPTGSHATHSTPTPLTHSPATPTAPTSLPPPLTATAGSTTPTALPLTKTTAGTTHTQSVVSTARPLHSSPSAPLSPPASPNPGHSPSPTSASVPTPAQTPAPSSTARPSSPPSVSPPPHAPSNTAPFTPSSPSPSAVSPSHSAPPVSPAPHSPSPSAPLTAPQTASLPTRPPWEATATPSRSSPAPPSSPTLSPVPTVGSTVLSTPRTTVSSPALPVPSSQSTTSQSTSLTTQTPTHGLLSSTLGVTAIPSSPATNLTTRQPSTTGPQATVFLTSSITAHGSSFFPTTGSVSTESQSISLVTSLPSSAGTETSRPETALPTGLESASPSEKPSTLRDSQCSQFSVRKYTRKRLNIRLCFYAKLCGLTSVGLPRGAGPGPRGDTSVGRGPRGPVQIIEAVRQLAASPRRSQHHPLCHTRGACSVKESEEEVTYQGCTANITVTRCEGVCTSSASFNTNTMQVASTCSCCHPVSSSEKPLLLPCADPAGRGRQLTLTVHVFSSCACRRRPCGD